MTDNQNNVEDKGTLQLIDEQYKAFLASPLLERLLSKVNGKKTYIFGWMTKVSSVLGFFAGSVSLTEMLVGIGLGGGIVGGRHAIDKLDTKLGGTNENS